MTPPTSGSPLDPQEEQAKRAALASMAKTVMTAKPENRAAILQSLDKTVVQDLVAFMVQGLPADKQAQAVATVQAMQKSYRPETDEQLWQYIVEEVGIRVPRNAVCEGHCAPFDFVADAYFERGILDKLIIGNRGSGKTKLSGMLHGINAKHKPKIEAVSAGAIENQAKKCYEYFKQTVMLWPDFFKKRDVKIRESNFPNGSKVEVVIGTMSGVNSPHPNIAHLDEIELLRPGVYEESANMAQSRTVEVDGELVTYRAQNWLTSSWKKPRGLVTKIFDEIKEAIANGVRPPYQVYRWCVFETTQNCPDDCNDCPLANVVKGKWEDGTPRTFEAVCKKGSLVPGEGRLKRSDGFITLDDTITKFLRLPKRVWEAQQESKRPTAEGLVYDVFDEDVHAVALWEPDPALGPIDVGVDFGGKNPFAAVFFQTLNVELAWEGRRLPEGTVVIFDEVYRADIGNVTFGLLINDKINEWEARYPGFRASIMAFYRDPAAKAAAIDLRNLPNHGAGDPRYQSIPTISRGGVEVDQSIAFVYERFDQNEIMVDTERCVNVTNELLSYEYPEGQNSGQPKKENDHAMDAMRYRMWNVHLAQGRGGSGVGGAFTGAGATGAPRTHARKHVTPLGAMTPGGRGGVRIGYDPMQLGTPSARVEQAGSKLKAQPEIAALPRVSPKDPRDGTGL